MFSNKITTGTRKNQSWIRTCVPGHYDPKNSKSSVTCIVAFNLSGSTKTFTMFLIHTRTHTPKPKDTLEHVEKVRQQILGVIEK